MDDLQCLQRCMRELEEYDVCQQDCISERRRMREAAKAAARRSVPRSSPPPKEDSLSIAFVIPGVLIVLVAAIAGIMRLLRRRQEKAWASAIADMDTEAERQAQVEARGRFSTIEKAFAELKSHDEAFSRVLFEDFIHALYVEAQMLRGGNRVARLAPYLSDAAQDTLSLRAADGVSSVIVGATEIQHVKALSATRSITVQVGFEANYTESRDGSARTFYVQEVWTFSRSLDTRSRSPERARVIDCLECGAALDKVVGGTCGYCNASADPGERDWCVADIKVVRREQRGPQLTSSVAERGNELPTLVAPNVKAAFASLTAADPSFNWGLFEARVNRTFQTFHRAWSAQELKPMRALMSDTLLDAQRYWVQAYQTAKLRNITEDPKVVTINLSRILKDKYYWAVTVRVFATCLDFTLDEQDRLVTGSRTFPREYTEYWTFIRSVAVGGTPDTEPSCPNCGANIDAINMAGVCEHCHVKVTAGEFDWVLSRIEQDETYRL